MRPTPPKGRAASIPAPPGRDRWLLSYADFVTLLLALFVVLYASARIDAESQGTPFDGLQAAFFFDEGARAALPVDVTASEDESEPREEPDPREALRRALDAALASAASPGRADHGAQVHQDERGLIVSLSSAEFFPAGGVEIPAERRAVLATLAPLLAPSNLSLRFEGHTDDQPIESDLYPLNWELSTARAAAVARLFIEEHGIEPERVATSGYAAYRPLVPNRGPAERARNRRVEIVVLQGEAALREDAAGPERDLDRLLEGLPPIPSEVDESLRPPDPGPAPESIPLP